MLPVTASHSNSFLSVCRQIIRSRFRKTILQARIGWLSSSRSCPPGLLRRWLMTRWRKLYSKSSPKKSSPGASRSRPVVAVKPTTTMTCITDTLACARVCSARHNEAISVIDLSSTVSFKDGGNDERGNMITPSARTKKIDQVPFALL